MAFMRAECLHRTSALRLNAPKRTGGCVSVQRKCHSVYSRILGDRGGGLKGVLPISSV